jgi:hypothetical protein
MAKSSGSAPGVKAMEREVNPVRGKTTPGGKPGVKAMEKEVNPVKRGKAGANVAKVGGTSFKEKRSSIRGKKKV